MTASLYQSASSTVATEGMVLSKLVEPGLRVRAPLDAKDVGRKHVRAELDVVAASGPFVAPAPEEVVHDVGLARRDAELLRGEIDPARLHVPRIEVHRGEDEVVL